jgi:hypothetical protein
MKAQILKTKNGTLSTEQLKAFEKFRRGLAKKIPGSRLTWVHSLKKTVIEAGLESQKKMTYRKTLQAAKLAMKVQDETGVLIILR